MKIWTEDIEFVMWEEYCTVFYPHRLDEIREGCSPVRLEHATGSERAVILIHGLSDSPWFLRGLAAFFHFRLGYDVYLPLLAGHGLKDPEKSMDSVSLEQWKENVEFAINSVSGKYKGRQLSVGGLSMGGALSYYFGCTNDAIDGELFLFSAAFGLKDGFLGIEGRVKELLLRTPVTRLWKENKELTGKNPYRYEYVSINSVKELARLMDEIRKLNKFFSRSGSFPKPVFSAFSEFDDVVSLRALKNLISVVGGEQLTEFRIPAAEKVDHASLVLNKPICGASGKILEGENPLFEPMVESIAAMVGF
ncbi:alpha/beta hydrolase [Desulfomarina sp.]